MRRDAPQSAGRGQRNGSFAGLRSASITGEFAPGQSAEPQPYSMSLFAHQTMEANLKVQSDRYILRKFRGHPPSLIIHLYEKHFRLGQDVTFSYKSPVAVLLQHLRSRTIPHDLVEWFNDTAYYDGCLIVQIHDHKSIAQSQNPDPPKSGLASSSQFSIHKYNNYLTPSSYSSYPIDTKEQGDGKKPTPQKDKENMPAPGLPNGTHRESNVSLPRKAKIYTVVLRPTALSKHAEFVASAAEAQSSSDATRDVRQEPNGGPQSASVPPTPTTAAPPTPQTSNMAPPAKRQKKSNTELTTANIYAAEAQITLATTAPLMLEPVHSAREAGALLESLAHPMHSASPPAPKTRKRTVAEMAADEAQAADQERHMLTFDERHVPHTAGAQGASNSAGNDGHARGISFEPRFERFKALEQIKVQVEENKKADKLKREEAERKIRMDQERNKLRDEAEKREQEKTRAAAMQQNMARHQMVQDNQRRQMQVAQNQQGLQGAPHPQQGTPLQVSHAHPQPNGNSANGMAAQPQRFHQQQVSQAQAASPIIRNGTPQNHSSPIVNNMGNVPMQHSTSSMGGSPPRPGSVVHQNHSQMGAPTSHVMAQQRSQQSHAGTPRMPVSTPNIQSTPLNRQVQTPRLAQGSPMQGSMATMQVPMMNGQPMAVNPQQAQAMQNQQRMAQLMQTQRQQQHAQQAAQQGMSQQMSQQQFMMMRQQQQLAGQQAQQQGLGNPLAQTYAAQMASLAQRSGGGMPPNMNQNMMNNGQGMNGMNGMNGMTMQQMRQMQQIQQMQMGQQHAAQMHQQGQLNPQQQQPQNPQMMLQQQIMAATQQLYAQNRQKLAANYPNGIPEDVDRQLRLSCQQQAHTTVTRNFQARRVQQQQQAMLAQAQAQGGMQQNMNGMQHGMGM